MKSIALTFLLVIAPSCITEEEPVEPCDLSSECPTSRPWCDLTLAGGSCRPCENNGQCADGSFCKPGSGECVQCLVSDQCPPPTPVCNAATNTCEPGTFCNVDEDCEQIEAPRCDRDTNECVGCSADFQCARFDDTPACDDEGDGEGTCVECTVRNETACGDRSCSPTLLTCTDTVRGSVDVCGGCEADSECGDGMDNESDDHRCIELSFGEEHLHQGGHCLQRTTLGCGKPFTTLISAPSLSGAEMDDYCGINQELTTCEAVRSLRAERFCSGGDPGACAPLGARCEQLGVFLDRCTYSCSADSECPASGPEFCIDDFCNVLQ